MTIEVRIQDKSEEEVKTGGLQEVHQIKPLVVSHSQFSYQTQNVLVVVVSDDVKNGASDVGRKSGNDNRVDYHVEERPLEDADLMHGYALVLLLLS